MPLTSYAFILFACGVLIIYNLTSPKHRLAVLLAASYGFYAVSSLSHVILLCAMTVVAYGGARLIEERRHPWATTAAVLVVVSPLVIVKWFPFVPLMGDDSLSAGLLASGVPIGMSFFTLQAISYLIDVRRGVTKAERRLERVALYIAFFPKLLAGPIERGSDLMPQLRVLARSTTTNVYVGAKLMLWGFFCKLVIADNIASIVDRVLRAPSQESGATLVLTFILYAFSIYFDFLGYTSIAIGVARCFGVNLSQNFDRPYVATSLREFWRRWHITLSSWFRDYVYIPLGGRATHGFSRLGVLLVVFVLSGLWHGTTLHFAAWGAFHASFYWLEDQLRKRVRRPAFFRTLAVEIVLRHTKRFMTFAVVTLGWVFFRLSEMELIRLVLGRIGAMNGDISYAALSPLLTRPDSLWFFSFLVSGIALDSSDRLRSTLERVPDSPRRLITELACVNWFVVTLVLFGDLGIRNFTYAGF